ncbi:MAG: acyl-CoA dehydrogenase family protein [Bdellovibrionales bacterium]|nr:acyl-CoA dehydrogenase family protein [Bdellovibrionales bacterium]
MSGNEGVVKVRDYAVDLNASVAQSLFLGNIVEENLYPFPSIQPEERETLTMVVDSVKKFMEEQRSQFREFDVKGAQSDEYLQQLRELGLFGLIIPEQYDGVGFSNKSYARVLQETSRIDGSTSLTIGAHSSIGMRGLVLFGTPEQKQRYLPRLACGEMIAAFCLTEPGSGSDAASIKTTAEKQSDGSWILNGEKIWITNGPFADYFTVFAKTDSEQGKLSAFIVERAFAGVSTGHKEDKMGIRASATSSVTLTNVHVPAENLLGEEGKGFKVAMSILNSGRSGLGGGCVGAMKECIRLATEHATQRKQFGRSIAEFELVKEKIAKMAKLCFATESMVTMVANYSDIGCRDYSVEAAMSKVYGTEALWTVANEALQIAGGNGFMREFPYERIVRDSRINMIFEGTNEILRLFIALTGFRGAGEYLKEIGKSGANIFNDPIKGFGVLSGYAAKKFTQLTSVGRDRLSFVPSVLEAEATVVEQLTVDFSGAVEAILRRHGKGIIGKQYISKRVANSAILLFGSLAVLSRVSSMIADKGAAATSAEQEMAKLFIGDAKQEIHRELAEVDKNQDALVTSVADTILARGGYDWDIL